MQQQELLNASCRMAFAAFLHDLGKFAERAAIEIERDKLDTHLQMYCPRREAGERIWYTHRHAAFTALAWGAIEAIAPELIGDDVFPFAAWNKPDVDDSIVNAAARHHKPDTCLQWIVATADRVASGFEREEFERYNTGEDKTREGRTHYTARLLPLFEQLRLQDSNLARRDQMLHRYRLEPLSVDALFPCLADGYETDDKEDAQQEYRRLWDAFLEALDATPGSHRANWSLWLDHFDSAWACYTQAIPSATAFNVRPEVSLYDHSRTTAALAVALWRYHHERNDDLESLRKRLSDYRRPDWDEQKLLLIQGDFFGIQSFIFASGGETQRRAAKLLRGRSFHISLLTECAALLILDALSLPPMSQVINAAGKFLIVAPNTEATVEALRGVQKTLDGWFLQHCFGQSGIGLAWLPASCNDFLKAREGVEPPFRQLMRRLFEQLQTAKSRRFDLCGETPPPAIFARYLDEFDREHGVCAIDGRAPGAVPLDGTGRWISQLAADQIKIGEQIVRRERVLITTASLHHNSLRLPLFGYFVQFTGDEEASGHFGGVARSGELRRAWDFGLPKSGAEATFGGYARRYINGYVPRFGEWNAWEAGRYELLSQDLTEGLEPQDAKTLEHIACDDRAPGEDGSYRGAAALSVMKGDVDDLGRIFERGMEQPSFAKMASLSRQLNAFFAIWLPRHCADNFPSTYTVFAGGDDFFLIGPWRSTMRLAREMRSAFGRFVAENSDLHFSAGITMSKPGLPVRRLGEQAEQALGRAKRRKGEGGVIAKDGVTCFGHTVSWEEFDAHWALQERLKEFRKDLGLSTGYIYGLRELAEMSEDLRTTTPRIDSAVWPSRFQYHTRRMLERCRGMSEHDRRRWQALLGQTLGDSIRQYGSALEIALSIHLYEFRN